VIVLVVIAMGLVVLVHVTQRIAANTTQKPRTNAQFSYRLSIERRWAVKMQTSGCPTCWV
jgi:hypothetical protein